MQHLVINEVLRHEMEINHFHNIKQSNSYINNDIRSVPPFHTIHNTYFTCVLYIQKRMYKLIKCTDQITCLITSLFKHLK